MPKRTALALLAPLTLLVAALMAQWPLGAYTVVGSSMEPAFHCGRGAGCRGDGEADHVLIDRLAYLLHHPRVNDVVAIRLDAKGVTYCASQGVYIKRIVAVPGMTVLVNGPTEARSPKSGVRQPTHAQLQLGPDEYFVMGDNRAYSCDSRSFGPVKQSEILGRVVARMWPISRLTVM